MENIILAILKGVALISCIALILFIIGLICDAIMNIINFGFDINLIVDDIWHSLTNYKLYTISKGLLILFGVYMLYIIGNLLK
jgi:ABC-type uncharacterized transport system involved in gliding motility auxiliary subunit